MLILRLKIALILWLQGRSVDYTWSSHWRIVLTEQYTYMCVFMQLFVLFVLCFGAVFWCCVLCRSLCCFEYRGWWYRRVAVGGGALRHTLHQ